MTLSWSARRKLLYYAVGLVLTTMLLFVLWQSLLTKAPTCFDGTQNGTETAVDCGGTCARVCEDTALMPNILWARSVQTAPQTYAAVAYVENRTDGAGARAVPYSFQLFDAQNELVLEREGVVDLPPIRTIPVVVPGLDVGTRVVARTLFKFTALPTWERVQVGVLPQVRISDQQLAANGTRLSAVITNDGFTDIRKLEVVGVIFDSSGTVRAASRAVIDSIVAKGSEPVVFTWGQPLSDVARAEITVLPAF